MAAGSKVGIGRGRGSLAHRKLQAEVAPGMFGLKVDSEERASPMEHLSLLISNMALEGSEFEIEPVKFAFKNAVTTKDQLRSAVQLLISRCLQEQPFASRATELCIALSDVTVEDLSLRTTFLSLLQSTYKQKEDLRKERPPTKWLGCVALLAQAASRIRMPDGSPMAPVVKVTLESLMFCLDESATDEELECAAVQALTVGDILAKYGDAENVKKLNTAIFEVITIGSRGSKETRRKLLDVLETLIRKQN